MPTDPTRSGEVSTLAATELVKPQAGESTRVIPSGGAARESGPAGRRALRRFALLAALVTGAFALPLLELFRYALKTSLFSHVLLIPLVSAWWIWKRPGGERAPELKSSPIGAAVATLIAGLLLSGYWLIGRQGGLPTAEYLCWMTTAYLAALLAAALLTLGAGAVWAFRFPVLFLGFMIPWPATLVDAVETALQYASAEAAYAMLMLSGIPVLREGLIFRLPGLVFEVAQECSGIRSSLVLFITSVVGARLLLQDRWRRWVLMLAVIPLGILRNGFRILTLGWLCVHVDPAMINSAIHHSGGPIFFVLSLGPFFLLLWWLRRGERRRTTTAPPLR